MHVWILEKLGEDSNVMGVFEHRVYAVNSATYHFAKLGIDCRLIELDRQEVIIETDDVSWFVKKMVVQSSSNESL